MQQAGDRNVEMLACKRTSSPWPLLAARDQVCCALVVYGSNLAWELRMEDNSGLAAS